MWAEYKSFHAFGIPTPVLFAYLTDKAQSRTELEHDLIQKIVEIGYDVLSLAAYLRCVRYGPFDRWAYYRMVPGCEGGGALLYVWLGQIKSWYALSIRRLLRNMAVDQVLALVANVRLVEIDEKLMQDQK